MGANPDRTIHGSTGDAQIVRYNRAGKWYLEPVAKFAPRRVLTVAEAARLASEGGWYADRPGGRAFDAKVRALRGAR